MKIKGLDGKQYNLKLVGYVPLEDDMQERSSYHLEARKLLTNLFPMDRVLEEVPLPGSGGLTADFFIPAYNLIVEVQGEQHYKFIPHFHQTRLGFIASLKRDADKRKWCLINGIKMIELPFGETADEWVKRIRK